MNQFIIVLEPINETSNYHPLSKLYPGFSWSRTTGFSRPSVRWQGAPIPHWPRRVWGPWDWIPMGTGSSCSTCWRSMAMTPCWCLSSCAVVERQPVRASFECCTTGFVDNLSPRTFLWYHFLCNISHPVLLLFTVALLPHVMAGPTISQVLLDAASRLSGSDTAAVFQRCLGAMAGR